MTRTRLITSWILLIVGVSVMDLANDAFWLEVVGGLALAWSWAVATGGRR